MRRALLATCLMAVLATPGCREELVWYGRDASTGDTGPEQAPDASEPAGDTGPADADPPADAGEGEDDGGPHQPPDAGPGDLADADLAEPLDAGPVTAPDAGPTGEDSGTASPADGGGMPDACVPICDEPCGDDSCGGTCSGAACADGSVCHQGACCLPVCNGTSCMDGCGGACPCEGGHCVDNVCCSLTETDCSDGKDEDCDGAMDCYDLDGECVDTFSDVPELCSGSFCTAIGQMAMGYPVAKGEACGVGTLQCDGERACCRDWHGRSLSSSGFADVFVLGYDAWAVGASPVIKRWEAWPESWTDESQVGTTYPLNKVWGKDESYLWAVGEMGTIRRRLSGNWPTEASGTDETLTGVWGDPTATNVWAVGTEGVILHRTSQGWSVENGEPGVNLLAVWGSSSTDVWAVGDGCVIYYGDGTAWTKLPTVCTSTPFPNLHDVWGATANDVWVVGTGGTVLRYNGNVWTDMAAPTSAPLYGVWGSKPDDVWVVGANQPSAQPGIVLHWNGATWEAEQLPTLPTGITGYTLRGVSGRVAPATGGLQFGSCEVWAVGDSGMILQMNHLVWPIVSP